MRHKAEMSISPTKTEPLNTTFSSKIARHAPPAPGDALASNAQGRGNRRKEFLLKAGVPSSRSNNFGFEPSHDFIVTPRYSHHQHELLY